MLALILRALFGFVKHIFAGFGILVEMAELSNDDVLKLARLARLRLNDDEVDVFKKEISSILGYVEQLDKVDLKDDMPTYQVTGLTNVTRPDEEIDYGTSPKELLKNAPALENDQIKVKRMLDR